MPKKDIYLGVLFSLSASKAIMRKQLNQLEGHKNINRHTH